MTPAEQRANDHLELCWASCTALIGTVAIDWSTTELGHFTTRFTTPSAPWFAGNHVAPLQPGRYAVILPCLTQFDQSKGGCEGAGLEAQFDLTGSGSNLCATATNCAALRATPSEGPPGTMVAIDGWLPLTGLGASAFLSVGIEPAANGTPIWQGKPGYESAVPLLASTAFRVTAPPPWSSFPAMRPSLIQRTGMDPIAADPTNPRRFAYCGTAVIELTSNGGRTWSTISLSGIRAASATTNYPLPGSFSPATIICSAVALDARYPATIYAVLSAVRRDSGPPPFYFTGYVTRNSGRTWQPVPVPTDSEMGLFGGFRVDATSAQALFWSQSAMDTQTVNAFHVEETTDGGRSWQPAGLRCPTSGPCVALGPQTNGRCMAVGEYQMVETSADGGRSWTSTDGLSACATSQLIGAGANTLVGIHQEFGHPSLWLSTDSGATWTYIALPVLPGSEADPGAISGTVQMLPDGRLLVVGSGWYLLPAGGATWCRVPGAPTISTGQWGTAPVPIGDRIWWSDPTAGAALGVTLRSFPLSAVHC